MKNKSDFTDQLTLFFYKVLIFILGFIILSFIAYFITQVYNKRVRFLILVKREREINKVNHEYGQEEVCKNKEKRNKYEKFLKNKECEKAEQKSQEMPYLNAYQVLCEEMFIFKAIFKLKDFGSMLIELMSNPYFPIILSASIGMAFKHFFLNKI